MQNTNDDNQNTVQAQTSQNMNTKQKLAARRKLLSQNNRPKNSKRSKTKIIKKNIDFTSTSNNNITNIPININYQSSNNNNNSNEQHSESTIQLVNDTRHERNRSISLTQSNEPKNRQNSVLFSLSDHYDNRNIKQQDSLSLSHSPHHSNIQSIKINDKNSSIQDTNNLFTTNPNSNYSKNDDNMQIDDIRKFLTQKVQKGKTIQTFIRRNKSGIANRLYPSYEVYLKDNKKFVMFAKKRQKNRTSNYIITTDPDNLNKNSSSYLGKVRANFVGTEFIVYDNGRSPKENMNNNNSKNDCVNNDLRSELASVLYETNILGTKGPRKMTILIPLIADNINQDNNDKNELISPSLSKKLWQQTTTTSQSSLLMSSYKQNMLNDLLILHNKSPKWNENIGAYVLNFNGRVTMASVKNFQLVLKDNNNNDNDIILQFGRVGKDKFTMDLQYPLTPLQAFGICLSSFDNKLACE